MAKRVVSILASLTGVGVGVTSPTGAVVPMRAHPCLESHACVTAFSQLINQLIDLASYRLGDRLNLRLLGVTVLPLRTLDTVTGITQPREFTVRAIRARNRVWIL